MKTFIYVILLWAMASSHLYGQTIIDITANDVIDRFENEPEGITIRIVRQNLFGQVVIRWPSSYGKVASDGRLVSGESLTVSINGIETEVTGSRTSEVFETTITMSSLDLGDFFGSPNISRRIQLGNLTAMECVDGFWSEFNDPVGGDYGFVCFGNDIIQSGTLPLYLELADPRDFVIDETFMGDQCYAPEPSFGDFQTGGLTNLFTTKELQIILQSGASYSEAESCISYSKCWIIDRVQEGEGDVMARALFTFRSSDWDNLSNDWEYDYPIDGSYTRIGTIRERPVVDAGANESYCEASGEHQLSSVTTDGVWSDDNGYVSETGVFDSNLAPAGHHEVRYTVTDGFGCTGTDTKVITIHPSPVLSVSDKIVCVKSGVVPLEAEPGGGEWTGSQYIDGGNFNTNDSPPGEYGLVYSFTDGNGCKGSEGMTLTVSELPVTDAGDDIELCRSTDDLTLGGGSPAGGVWSGDHVSGNSFLTGPALTGNNTIYYTYANEEGCASTDSKVITINENPVVNAGYDTEICSGNTIKLTGSANGGNGDYSYYWFPESDLDDASLKKPTSSSPEDIIYTLTVTDGKGCKATDDIEVVVNPLPDIIITADGAIKDTTEICPGLSVDLRASGGVEYLWEPTTRLNNPYINDPVASPVVNTDYTVTVTDSKGCVSRKSIHIIVKEPLDLSMGGPLIFCNNDGPYDLRQDVSISGGTFSGEGVEGMYFFPEKVEPNVYIIQYTVLHEGCGYETVSREIEVMSLPETSISGDMEICAGTSVGLKATGGVACEWSPQESLDEANVAGPIATPWHKTIYEVLITGANGCVAKEDVAVTLLTATANAGVNTTICSGEITTLSASGGVEYSWSPEATLNDGGVKNPVAAPIETTTYTVTVTDDDGCQDSDEVTVTVTPLPVIMTEGPLKLCQSDTVADLRDFVSPEGGVFSGNIVDGVQVNPAEHDPGIYFVDYTVEENGCEYTGVLEVEILGVPEVGVDGLEVKVCLGDSVALPPLAPPKTGGEYYRWLPGEGLDDPESAAPVASPEESTLYTVTVTNDAGCVAKGEVYVEVADAVVDAGINQEMCAGGAVQLNASGGEVYSWSPEASLNDGDVNNPVASPAETTNYTVTATDINGCTGSDEVTVTVKLLPSIITEGPVKLCQSDEVADLRKFVLPEGGVFSGEIVDGVQVNPGEYDPGIYFVEYTGVENGCENTGVIEVEIMGVPEVGVEGEEVRVCRGDSVALPPLAPPKTGGEYYRWAPEEGLDDPESAGPMASPEESTLYTVTVTNDSGCVAKGEVYVEVLVPDLDAGINQEVCAGGPVQLNASGGEVYSWSPEETLNDGGIKNPKASPIETTTYTVTGTDINGCTDSDEVTVTVKPLPVIGSEGPLKLCQSDAPADLREFVSPEGGVYSGEIVEGVQVNPAEHDPGIYFVDYTVEVNGCGNMGVLEVEILEVPEVGVEGLEVRVCRGDSISLPPLAPPKAGGELYKWLPGEGLDDPESAGPVASPEESTWYTVTVTNENGCVAKGEVYVEVVDAVMEVTGEREICPGESTELTASGGASYKWYSSYVSSYIGTSEDEKTSEDEDGFVLSSSPSIEISPDSTSLYLVVGTDEYGCRDSAGVAVTVKIPDEVDAGGILALCANSEAYDLRQDVNVQGGVFKGEGVDGVLFRAEEAGEGIYFIEYTLERSGCVVTAQREVNISSIPDLEISNSQLTACKEDSVQLLADGEGTFEWFMPNGSLFSTEKDPVVASKVSTAYMVKLTDDKGCANSGEVKVIVTEAVATAGADVEICPRESTRLSADGGEKYSWFQNSNIEFSELKSPTVFPDTTTTYTVIVTDAYGCMDTDEVTVTVKEPEVPEFGAPLELCANSEAYDLRQKVNIKGGTFDGPGVDGVLLRPEELEEGIYFIDYTVESLGCEVEGQLEVVVHGVPVVEFEEEEVVVCKGGSIKLPPLPPLAPPRTGGELYRWLPEEGLSDAMSAEPVASPEESTYYTITVTDENECSASGQMLVEVTEAVATVSGDVMVCPGESTVVSASGGVEYEWSTYAKASVDESHSGWQFTGSTGSEVVVSPDSTTVFTVTVTDTNGCTDSEEVTVTVKDPKEVDPGEILELCVNSEAYDLRQDVNIPGGTFEGEGVDGLLLRPEELEEGIYFIDYTAESEGCVVTVQREVRVYGVPVVEFEKEEVVICKGEGVVLHVIPPLPPPKTGGELYRWAPVEGLSDSMVSNPWASPIESTNYTVTVTDENGCSASGQVRVEVREAETSISGNREICPGESTTLTASGGGSYEWSSYPSSYESTSQDGDGFVLSSSRVLEVKPDSTSTYVVVVTDEFGCRDSAEVTVTVKEPEVPKFGDPLELCSNSEAYDLRQEVNIPGGVFKGKGVDGVLLRTEELEVGIYFIDYTVESLGCEVEGQLEVVVHGVPVVEFEEVEVVVCRGESVLLPLLPPLPPPSTGGEYYKWLPEEGLDDPESAEPVASPEERTTYTLRITNEEGCSNTGQVTVDIDGGAFDAGSDFKLCINAEPVELASSKEGGAWEGPGIVNNVFDPISAGTGDVWAVYRFINDSGCLVEDSISITVMEEPVVDVGGRLEVCRDDLPVDLQKDVNLTGGEFEGTGMTGSFFDPGKGDNVNIITYSVRYHGCLLKGFREIIVHEATPFDPGEDLELCEGSRPVDLLKDIDIARVEISGKHVSDGYFYPDSAGPFEVGYSFINAYGCVSRAGRMVSVVVPKTIDAGPDQSLCNTVSSLDLSPLASHQGGVYTGANVSGNEFNGRGLEAGDYVIGYGYDNGNGCTSYDSLTITVSESPIKDFGRDTLLCIGTEPLDLNLAEELEAGVWTGAGVVNNHFISTLAGEGRHVLTYSNEAVACEVVGTRAITVVGRPAFASSEMAEVRACEGDFVVLTASLPETEANRNTMINWLEGGVKIGSGQSFTYQVGEPASIYYQSVNSFGCPSDQDSYIVISTDNPWGKISVSDTTPPFGSPVQFIVEEAVNTAEYLWDFGDGMISYEESPWHFYYSSDTFSISVALTSSSGCETEVVSPELVVVGEQPGVRKDIVTSVEGLTGKYNDYTGSLKILSLYPHPANEKITIGAVASRGGHYMIEINDINGAALQQVRVNLSQGYNEVSVHLRLLRAGMYILRLIGEEEQTSTKIYKR